jgi:hypothetical protein
VAYAPAWRWATAALYVVARGGLLAVAALLVLGGTPTPLALGRAVVAVALLPGVAAWLLERAFAVQLEVDAERVTAHGRGLRTEIDRADVAGATPWRVPLPGPGAWLRLRSGRRIGLATPDPAALLARLGHAAPAPPTLRWAAARACRPRRAWDHPVVRYPLFGLAPTAVVFRAHQWIAYGGTFGQYHLVGLRAYLTTFAVYWATVTIYLVLWANAVRVSAEVATLAAAHVAPARADAARRAAEAACAALYWGGVPLFLLLRFLP